MKEVASKEIARPADYVPAVPKSTGLQPLLFGSNLRILQGAAGVPGRIAERITKRKPHRRAFFFIRKTRETTTASNTAATQISIALSIFHTPKRALSTVAHIHRNLQSLKMVRPDDAPDLSRLQSELLAATSSQQEDDSQLDLTAR